MIRFQSLLSLTWLVGTIFSSSIIESGASKRITFNENLLKSIKTITGSPLLKVPNMYSIPVKSVRNIRLSKNLN